MASETHRELVIAYGGPVRFGFRVVSIERSHVSLRLSVLVRTGDLERTVDMVMKLGDMSES